MSEVKSVPFVITITGDYLQNLSEQSKSIGKLPHTYLAEMIAVGLNMQAKPNLVGKVEIKIYMGKVK